MYSDHDVMLFYSVYVQSGFLKQLLNLNYWITEMLCWDMTFSYVKILWTQWNVHRLEIV